MIFSIFDCCHIHRTTFDIKKKKSSKDDGWTIEFLAQLISNVGEIFFFFFLYFPELIDIDCFCVISRGGGEWNAQMDEDFIVMVEL